MGTHNRSRDEPAGAAGSGVANVRDLLLALGGLAVLGWEVFGPAEPRMAVLAIAAGMLGLPGATFMDRKQRPGGGEDK